MKSTKATGSAAGTKKQASGTAGLSLRELEREELDEIHRKRQELSRALKEGKLSREKIDEINSRKRKSDERGKERKRKKSPPAMRMRADDYEKRTREEKT